MEGKLERRDRWQPFVYGLVAGAVVGGALGVFFAPRTGKDIRAKLGDVAYRVRERVAGHPLETHTISKN